MNSIKVKQNFKKIPFFLISFIVILALSIFFIVYKDKQNIQSINPVPPSVEFVGEYKIGDGDWIEYNGKHIPIKRGKDVGFVAVDRVGNGYQLPVKSSLLSQVGDVTFQFVVTTPSGTIMKFDSFVMTVEDAIDTDAPLPEEYPTWGEMANTKLAEVDAAVALTIATGDKDVKVAVTLPSSTV